jgi:carboxypeptidase Q
VPDDIGRRYGDIAARLLEAARTDSLAHERLRHLCDSIGPRLSGSKAMEEAVRWTADLMRKDGLDSVRIEPVMVPHWVRGAESATLVEPREAPLRMLGLGNSVGTPPEGITAEVVVAADFDALEALGERVRGRIVLFNRPMQAFDPATGTGYGEAVAYRVNGPSRASALGAVACLVRSVTARSLATPHTGMLRYAEDIPPIPAAAISTEDAETLARLFADGERVVVRLRMEARFEDDAPSHNVVGEITGSELPGEIVLLGAHLDSWDVGHGAHDDGGPCLAVVEALRLIRAAGLRPRRTLRAVLFTNEENGLRGGRAYADTHSVEVPLHRFAIETDSGAFRPLGFTTPAPTDSAGAARWELQRQVLALLDPVGAGRLSPGGGGADITPLEERGVPVMGLDVDMSTYFDIHHTEADTFDKVVKEDLDLCVGVLAVVGFVLADL